MPVGHLWAYIKKMSIQAFCQFLILFLLYIWWIVWVPYSFLISLIRWMVCKYFLPFWRSYPHYFVSFAFPKLLDWRSPICQCVLCSLCCWDHIQKIKIKKNHCICQEAFLLYFLLVVLKFLILYLKILIYFELIFVYVWDKGLVSFFCMWISSFFNTISWRNSLFSTVCSWYPLSNINL